MPSLFTGLTDDDKLKKLLEGLNNGSTVQVGDPVIAGGDQQEEGASHSLPTRDQMLQWKAENAPTPPDVPADQNTQAAMLSSAGGADQSGMPGATIPNYEPSPEQAALVSNMPMASQAPAPPVVTPQPFQMPAAGTSVDDLNKQIQTLQNSEYQDPHHHSTLGRLFKGLAKGYQNWNGQDGLIGLAESTLGGGIGSAASPKIYAGLEKKGIENKLFTRLNQQQGIEKYDQDAAYNKARTQNIYDDNERAQQQQKDIKDYRDAQIDTRNAALEEQRQKRADLDRHTQMRIGSQMLKSMPSYDPNNPKFAELTKYLKDVNLPVYKKDAKKQVRMVQDAETGAWTVALTDPISGEQEVRPVTTKDGKQLVTISPTKVSADAASNRQESSQQFTTKRDQVKQDFAIQRQQLAQQLSAELQNHADLLRAGRANEAESSRKRIMEYQAQLAKAAAATDQ